MQKNRAIKISKFLSNILRHHPQAIGLHLEENGWAKVSDILEKSYLKFSLEELKEVVEQNDKKRFSFNEDLSLIRANQGHSVDVRLEFKSVIPPDILYHGTHRAALKSIQQQGLKKGKRHHVHLSKDIHTATQVGKRYGEVVILAIKAGDMCRAGYLFYISENEVYLVDKVPVNYLQVL